MPNKVSENALLKRVNRVLKKNGEVLRKARNRQEDELGHFYMLDRAQNSNFVIQRDVDMESLARELGVLSPRETVAA